MAEAPPSWITNEFLEKVLRADGNHPNITVVSSEIKPATSPGDNYGSEMYRVALKTEENGESEDMSIIMKCDQRSGLISKEMQESVFVRESKAYTDVHGPICKMLKEAFPDNFHPFAPNCLYVSVEPNAIVLEDLKKEGFRLATANHGLDLKHCLLVMRTIAQYHAASHILLRQDPSVFQKLLDRSLSKKSDNGLSVFLSYSLKSLRNEVEKWAGYEKYVDVLKDLENSAVDHWIDATNRDDSGFNVLTHGDFQLRNLMFRYSEENELEDIRLVDFQASYVTSPAVDLQYFMNSSASHDVLENDRHLLINQYYDTLCKILSALGHQDLQPTKETIIEELDKKGLYGSLSGFAARPLTLVDRNNLPDVENFSKNEGNANFCESFKDAMKRLLPLYEQWGWLKV